MPPASPLAWLLAAALLAVAAAAAASAPRSREAHLQEELSKRGKAERTLPPRPPAGGNVTLVEVKILLKNFYFDMGEEKFNIITWLLLDWRDSRLVWEPATYADIHETEIPSSDIWMPRLELRNAVGFGGFGPDAECSVRSAGEVHCQAKMFYDVWCSETRFADWPYDARNCSFEFDNDGQRGVELTFGGRRGVSMLGAEYGPAWTVVDYEQEERRARGATGVTGVQLHLALRVERQGAALGALAVWPALALSALSLGAAALPPPARARAPLAAFSLAAHFALLRIVSTIVPQRGHDSPTILQYVRASLAVTSASIVLTLGLGRLPRRATAPQWVARMNAQVARSPARLLLCWRHAGHSRHAGHPRHPSQPRHSGDILAEAVLNIHRDEWLDFLCICGVLEFIVEFITYVSLYLLCVPQPPAL